MDVENIPREILERSIEKELCERSLYYYFQQVLANVTFYKGVEWEMNWHYEEILAILEAELHRIIAGEPKTKDLAINLPYRSGKSTMLEIFASYCWVLKPEMKLLFIASSMDLSKKSSGAVKKIIEDEWFKSLWGDEIVISKDTKAKSNFANTRGGNFLAYGISNATGRGGDIAIIDDPSQSADAHSDAALRNVVNAYRDSIYSRLNDFKTGLRIICQQRISAKDLVGTLKTTNPHDFRWICIPATLTKDCSPEFRQFYDEDGLFWSTRYSLDELQKHKNTMTPTAYASQLLQSSSVYEGTYIKRHWIKTIKQSQFQKINDGKTYLFIDTNLGGDNRENDPNGLLVCSVVNGIIYVIKFQEKWEQLYELVQSIIELLTVYNIKKIYIENASTAKNVVSELKRQLRRQASINYVNPGTKSKEERVNAVQPHLVNGKVVIVEDDWNTLYMNYLADFNHGKHDEAVDLTVYAILTLIARRYQSSTTGGEVVIKDKDDKGMVYDHDDFDMSNLY